MQPVVDICGICNKPIVGTVYTKDGDDVCWACCTDREPDMVNSPPHYNQAGIECIDAMKAMSAGATIDAHQAYCWQNTFKYLWRWPYKNGLQDLRKARWYLDRLITDMEKNNADV